MSLRMGYPSLAVGGYRRMGHQHRSFWLPRMSLPLQTSSVTKNNNNNSTITTATIASPPPQPSLPLPPPPPDIQIMEVGPRDGLQNESVHLTATEKVQFIQRLARAGCSKIEVGAFVSPRLVPSMADSFGVMEQLRQWKEQQRQSPLVLGGPPPPSSSEQENILPISTETVVAGAGDDDDECQQLPTFSCLVPNMVGLEKALQVGVEEIAIFGSASETFCRKNIGCTITESLERFRPVTETARQHGLPVRGYVSCVIACPYEGRIAPKHAAHIAEQLLEMGCYQVSLGDTIGVGTPHTIQQLLDELFPLAASDDTPHLFAAHYHDTFGQGLANLLVSLEWGIRTIDTSVAGLGGCPYAPGATGNVATEDVVYMLHGMGLSTGIDLDRLVDAAQFVCERLGHPSRSRAGVALAAAAAAQKSTTIR